MLHKTTLYFLFKHKLLNLYIELSELMTVGINIEYQYLFEELQKVLLNFHFTLKFRSY